LRPNTGNFLDSGLGNALTGAKKVIKLSALRANSLRIRTGNFLRPYRELNRGEQGNSGPDQGISRSSAIWRFTVVTTPIVPTDLERCRESEQGRRQIFEVADADLGARGAGFVHLKACSTHAAEHVDTNDRHSGRYTELTRDGGRGFASPFLHRRKADAAARPYPFLGTLTFFGTVFMAHDYSNQFCLNDRRNSIVPINI
jgi:hypothetical protein